MGVRNDRSALSGPVYATRKLKARLLSFQVHNGGLIRAETDPAKFRVGDKIECGGTSSHHWGGCVARGTVSGL